MIRQQVEEIEELKKGRRRELIGKYYPPLAENLRLSLSNIAYNYIQGYQEHAHLFDELVDMANDSTLRFIQGLDERLYDDLKSILDHFIPAEKEIDRKKDESWEEIPRKWQRWIEDNYSELPKLGVTPETLAMDFSLSLRWPLWRKDEPLLRQNFFRYFDGHFILGEDEEKISELKKWMFEEIVRIAEEEWNPIKDEYEKLHEELKILITNRILPRMDATLRSLGE